jgi:hypothetical protein
MTDMSHETPFDTGPFDQPPIMPDQDGNYYEPTISDQVAELASLMSAFATRVDVLTDAVGRLLPHQFNLMSSQLRDLAHQVTALKLQPILPITVGPHDRVLVNLGHTATMTDVRGCADALTEMMPELDNRIIFVTAEDVAVIEATDDPHRSHTGNGWIEHDPDRSRHPDTWAHRWTCPYGPRCPARKARKAFNVTEHGGRHI